MASFTDTTPQFKEYVSQMPVVEAMVNVGTQKQAAYNEGYQRIQSNIDQIAGLDIMRDTDKQYLQSKLNQLGTDLKSVAAGDFSNYQLVNSIGGMINKIGKDKNIQNAVASTHRIRKGQSELEEARKAGKSAVQNEYWWNKQVGEYLNDTNLDTRFSGEYTPYTDVGAKLRQLAKDLPEIESVQDIPFKRDENGNITGEIDMAMLKVSSKSKSAKRIMDTFTASLSEQDIQQLRIDASYHYQGATSQSLQAGVMRNYQNSKDMIEDRMSEISAKLSDGSLSAKDRESLNTEFTEYSSILNSNSLEKERDKQLMELSSASDLENYKYQVYTTNYLSGLANSLAYENYKQTVETNPYWQGTMQLKQLQLQYDRIRQADEHFRMNYDLKLKEVGLKEQEYLKKYGLLGTGVALPGGLSTDLPVPTLGTVKEKADELQAIKDNFINKNIDKIVPNANEFNKLIDKVNNDRTLSAEEKERKIQDINFKKRSAFTSIYGAYAVQGKKSDDTSTNFLLEEYKRLNDEQLDYIQLLNNAEKIGAEEDLQIQKEIENLPSYTMKDGTVITPQDVLAYNEIRKKHTKYTSPIGVATGGRANVIVDDKGILDEIEGTKLEKLHTNGKNDYGFNEITYYTNKIVTSLDSSTKNLISERDKKRSDYLQERLPEYQSIVEELSANEGATSVIQQVAKLKQAMIAQGQKLDLSSGEKFDSDALNDWLSKQGVEKSLGYEIVKRPDGTAKILITKGSEQQTIPLNSNEFSQFFPSFAAPNPDDRITRKIAMSDKGTTNVAGYLGIDKELGAPTARYNVSSGYTPKLMNSEYKDRVRFDVQLVGNGLYDIILYVLNDDNKWIANSITPNGANAGSITPTLYGIGNNSIKEFLEKNQK